MALPFTDNFNRADANPIGGNWSQIGSWAVMKIASNVAIASIGGNSTGAWCNSETPNADQYAQCKFSGAFSFQGPVCRTPRDSGGGSGTRTGYILQAASSTSLELYRTVANSWTQLAIRTVSTMVLGTTVAKLSVAGVGATVTLKIWVGGVQQGADVSDSDAARLVNADAFGMYSENTGAIDDFEGGNGDGQAVAGIVADIFQRNQAVNRASTY